MAILAGDALLTLAFRLVADNAALAADPRVIRDVVVAIADASGTDGMVGGQVVDIESEGKTISAEMLDYIHSHKTAALIRASLVVGRCSREASAPRSTSSAALARRSAGVSDRR